MLLIVLTSLASYERGVTLVRNALLVTVPVLVVLVALLVWWVVGRALRPVETMRREVARITAERLDRRLRQPPTEDEIGRLAGTLNDMLDRLQSSRDVHRRFVADASHELRTPIANIRLAVEVANAKAAYTATTQITTRSRRPVQPTIASATSSSTSPLPVNGYQPPSGNARPRNGDRHDRPGEDDGDDAAREGTRHPAPGEHDRQRDRADRRREAAADRTQHGADVPAALQAGDASGTERDGRTERQATRPQVQRAPERQQHGGERRVERGLVSAQRSTTSVRRNVASSAAAMPTGTTPNHEPSIGGISP